MYLASLIVGPDCRLPTMVDSWLWIVWHLALSLWGAANLWPLLPIGCRTVGFASSGLRLVPLSATTLASLGVLSSPVGAAGLV